MNIRESRSLRLAAAWTLHGLALLAALAFATYQPEVPGLAGGGNLAGPPGRWLAAVLVEAFGVGAFGLCFFLLHTAWLLQRSRPIPRPFFRVAALFLGMFFFGAACQTLLPRHLFPVGGVPLGGIIGDVVSARVAGAVGAPGTAALLATGVLGCLVLVSDGRLPGLRPSGDSTERRSRLRALALSLQARVAGRTGPATREEEDEEGAPTQTTAPRAGRRARSGQRLPEDPEPEDELEATWEEEDSEDPEPAEEEPGPGGEEEDEEPAAEEAPRRPPRISQSAAAPGDGIEVIRLTGSPLGRSEPHYEHPPVSLLQEPPEECNTESPESLQRKARHLEEALQDFNIQAQVEEVERGPVVTRFDLSLARGTKISRVTSLSDDLALGLGVRRVRIAPVKGKTALGVEIPNRKRETVYLRELAVTSDIRKRRIAIPLFLGKDTSGHPLVEDLGTTPHLLIAGRTGAGKSVFVNSLVLSILLTRYPEEVRLIMIDPKKVELEVYQGIPHLLTNVVSNPKRAAKLLEWAVDQMEQRYEYLAATGVRHLVSYNRLSKKSRRERLARYYSEDELQRIPDHLPYMVIIVDELADLMMVAGKEVEQAIARLAQKARAVGLHVVLATQRPSTDVITGLIKSNLPARIAFQTRTGIDSRTILDRYGAEKLLDRGDMLYLSSTSDDPRRIQGPFVSDEEVERVVSYLKQHAAPLYTHHLEQVAPRREEARSVMEQDELFEKAVETVLASGQASASFLQRRMQIGYARASRLIDLIGEAGIVSEHRGSKAREILITPEQWEEMRKGKSASAT